MKTKVILTMAFFTAHVGATLPPVNGDLIFSQSYTGADLFNDTSVMFPTRAPSVSGSSLVFGTGVENLEKLFSVSLVDEGVLNSNFATVMTVSANLTRLQDDFDHELTISDGTLMAGFQSSDNNSGQGQGVGHQDMGNTGATQEFFQIFANAGFPAIGNAFDVAATITIAGGTTNVAGGFNSDFGNGDLPTINLDATKELNFVFLANHLDEEYRINSLTIELEGTRAVPEPNSMVFFALSGCTFLVRRYRKIEQEQSRKGA